jgi:hypothetical protein
MEADDDKAPMTVKGMPVRARQRALKAANKQGQSMAEWLTRAIDQLADREEGERETFPDERANLPAIVGPVSPAVIPPGFLSDLTEAMGAAKGIADAAGVPVPKATARHAFAILTDHLRLVRGLAPVKPRQTKPGKGQTLSVGQEAMEGG